MSLNTKLVNEVITDSKMSGVLPSSATNFTVASSSREPKMSPEVREMLKSNIGFTPTERITRMLNNNSNSSSKNNNEENDYDDDDDNLVTSPAATRRPSLQSVRKNLFNTRESDYESLLESRKQSPPPSLSSSTTMKSPKILTGVNKFSSPSNKEPVTMSSPTNIEGQLSGPGKSLKQLLVESQKSREMSSPEMTMRTPEMVTRKPSRRGGMSSSMDYPEMESMKTPSRRRTASSMVNDEEESYSPSSLRSRLSSRTRNSMPAVYDTLKSLSSHNEEVVDKIEVSSFPSIGLSQKSSTIKVVAESPNTGRSLKDYETELSSLDILFLEIITVDQNPHVKYLLSVIPTGSKVMVEVKTTTTPVIYSPENGITIKAVTGHSKKISETISLKKCDSLSACTGAFFVCDDEVCVLNSDSGPARSDYVLAEQTMKEQKSIHRVGSLVALPIVKYEVLFANKDNIGRIFDEIENSSRGYLSTAMDNAYGSLAQKLVTVEKLSKEIRDFWDKSKDYAGKFYKLSHEYVKARDEAEKDALRKGTVLDPKVKHSYFDQACKKKNATEEIIANVELLSFHLEVINDIQAKMMKTVSEVTKIVTDNYSS